MTGVLIALLTLVLGIALGVGWAAYQGYQTHGAALRRVKRLHPRWFDSKIDYPTDNYPLDEDDRSDGIVRGPFKPMMR